MVDWIGYGSLAAESSDTTEGSFEDFTIEVPRGDVVAATAITGFSQGQIEFRAGSVATYIREYGQFAGFTGRVNRVEVPPDAINSSMFIRDCAYVRFRMTVVQARAFAVALVFHFKYTSPVAHPLPRLAPSKYFKLARRSSDQIVGTHQVAVLSRGSTLKVDRAISQSVGEVAAFLGVGRRALQVVPATRRDVRRPGPRTAGVF